MMTAQQLYNVQDPDLPKGEQKIVTDGELRGNIIDERQNKTV